MEQTYYSVAQVSKMLGLHEKTLQRYIREGKLKAGKFGKAYRISGDDLSDFTEASGITLAPTPKADTAEHRISVSAVVDIVVTSNNEADRIETMLIAGLNSKDPSYGRTSVNLQRIEGGKKLRILLWGSGTFVETMLSCINIYEKG